MSSVINIFLLLTAAIMSSNAVLAASRGSLKIKSANFQKFSYNDLSCALSFTEPTPKRFNYTFKDCLTIEFAAYMNYNNRLSVGNYYEFGQGTVNEKNSRCYKEKGNTIIEPKMVIEYGRCGRFELEIDPFSGEPDLVVNLVGNLALKDIRKEYFSLLLNDLDIETEKCVYYKSFEKMILNADFGVDFVATDLTYEIHRGISGNFEGCK